MILSERLDLAAAYVVKCAKDFVINQVPDKVLFYIAPVDMRIPFDADNLAWLNARDATASLANEYSFPEWVDLTPVRIDAGYLYVLLERSRLLVPMLDVINKGSRINPFKCKSPVLPSEWAAGVLFDINRGRTYL